MALRFLATTMLAKAQQYPLSAALMDSRAANQSDWLSGNSTCKRSKPKADLKTMSSNYRGRLVDQNEPDAWPSAPKTKMYTV